MSEVRFIDTTLRDGNQSLWALNMPVGAMLPAAPHLDEAGFESMEFFLSVMFKKYARELKEDAWEWLRQGTKKFRKTQLRYHGGMHSAFEKTPHCILKLLVERLVSYGLTLTRTSNCWNDYTAFKEEIADLKRNGMDTVANLIYSVSPRHTDEYYATKAREAAAIRPYRICFKDVGGLLTPERARTLIPVVLRSAGDVPVEFHAHCNSGQAPLCYLEAVKLGMRVLHTAVPPLANGSSQPSIFNVAHNLRALGYTPVVDEKPLEPVRRHFTSVAKRLGLPIGRPVEYDYSQYLHQVPGGMISNMRHQLKIVGMEDKMEAALEEAARVRADFGYPIMVTPLSQYVGTQAAINVILGERYKEVPDQVIQYALGIWGKEGAELMDPAVKDKILSRPRAREWREWRQPEPSLHEIRQRLGVHLSDEELILRFFAGNDAVDALLRSGKPRTYLDGGQPLVKLIEQLSKREDSRQIYIRRPGFSVRLEKRAP
ncbi:MAG TPA: biotin carboxyl carrier protein [candidate division Zixibacteria bacterium]|nr:biotin carboxyl carrier protein [candidate division Zixibacteria bacterium]